MNYVGGADAAFDRKGLVGENEQIPDRSIEELYLSPCFSITPASHVCRAIK